MVPYYLDEKNDWKLNRDLLEDVLAKARAQGTRVKAICVINPGNPTGAVLDEANIAMILDFAQKHGLSVLADEVYQENVYLARVTGSSPSPRCSPPEASRMSPSSASTPAPRAS